jgi:hypothetical protein
MSSCPQSMWAVLQEIHSPHNPVLQARPAPIDNLHAAHRDHLLFAARRKFTLPVGRERKPAFLLAARQVRQFGELLRS